MFNNFIYNGSPRNFLLLLYQPYSPWFQYCVSNLDNKKKHQTSSNKNENKWNKNEKRRSKVGNHYTICRWHGNIIKFALYKIGQNLWHKYQLLANKMASKFYASLNHHFSSAKPTDDTQIDTYVICHTMIKLKGNLRKVN